MYIEKINNILWGFPVLILIIGGGIFLSAKIKFPQIHIFRILKISARSVFSGTKCDTGGISQLQGFSTALAATVGTGSIVGVGGAMAVGGPGSVFWMWVSAFIGMGISYCENYLGVKFSVSKKTCGAISYLEKMGKRNIAAMAYAVCSVFASFGMGNMAQANSVVSAASEGFSIHKGISAFAVVVFTAFTVSGADRTAGICERLVPFMSIFFCIGSLYIIAVQPSESFMAFKTIISEAFSPKAFLGGAIGTSVVEGIKRGAFSNEAGLGSTTAVHSSCNIKSAETQGILGMAEVFIDTIIICTLTAMVIIVSKVDITQTDCAVKAYSKVLNGFGSIFISISLILFALATIAGWFFIGEKAWKYLFPKHSMIYRIICVLCAYFGAVHSSSLIWGISDIFNGLMAIPNMIGVLVLSGHIERPKFHPQRDE